MRAKTSKQRCPALSIALFELKFELTACFLQLATLRFEVGFSAQYRVIAIPIKIKLLKLRIALMKIFVSLKLFI